MSGENISPNMLLPIPGVGITEGPQYATDVNSCLTIVDQHNHTTGSGVQIPTGGININADLTFANHNAINLRSVRMSSNNAALADVDDLDCLYVITDDLYFNDGNGNVVRITESGSVAGTPGSISGLVSPASASYVALDQTFVWQSNVNVAANMDAGSIILRNLTSLSKGLTLNPPSAMGADYSITLPTLPASQKIMTLDASGNMSAPYVVDNSTIEIATNVIQVKDLGITDAKIANATITADKLAAGVLSGLTTLQSQTFTANGNFTVPAGVTEVFAFMVGGGGGGGGGGSPVGGGETNAAGGGGEGAPIVLTRLSVTPAVVMPVVVGTAGSAGARSTGSFNSTDGGNGGASTFGGITARGGVGGQRGFDTNAAGLGGSIFYVDQSTVLTPLSIKGQVMAGGNGGATIGSTGQTGTDSIFASGGAGGAIGGASTTGGGGGGASLAAGTAGGAGFANAPSGPAANTGAGGGGGGSGDTAFLFAGNGAAGGSGVVVILYGLTS